jgi:hypothetical protein
MSYEVLEVIALPIMEDREVHPGIVVPVAGGNSVRKEPGDTVTDQEFKAHGQTQKDIDSLIECAAIRKRTE